MAALRYPVAPERIKNRTCAVTVRLHRPRRRGAFRGGGTYWSTIGPGSTKNLLGTNRLEGHRRRRRRPLVGRRRRQSVLGSASAAIATRAKAAGPRVGTTA